MKSLVLVLAIAACAPTVDGPVEHQRALDVSDGDRLGAQLAALPGAISAHVTLHRPVADPLSLAAPPPAGAAVLLVVDDRADRTRLAADARALTRAAAPEIASPEIVVEVGATRAELASVGPFTVDAHSKKPLTIALALLLAAIAALAGYVAVRATRR